MSVIIIWVVTLIMGIAPLCWIASDNLEAKREVVVSEPVPYYEEPSFQEVHKYNGELMFTELFNSYETKWSKNGRLMIRQGDSGSYKFVKKA